jgi:hypothetical protein
MFEIGRQVEDAGLHGAACAFRQFGKAEMARLAPSFEYEPQSFLDKSLSLQPRSAASDLARQ